MSMPMVTPKRFLAKALLLCGLLVSCGPMIVGGPCKYDQIPGVAVVVSIEEQPASEGGGCSNPVRVVFNFVPDDPDATAGYRFPERSDDGHHLTVSGGFDPPSEWVQAEGLVVGSAYPAVRKEIVRGTCTPVIFEFTELDYEAGSDMCWQR